MDLFDVISNDIKEAMKAKDKVKLETLRNVKKFFLEAKTSVLLTRVLPAYTGAAGATTQTDAIISDTIPVEVGFTAEGWFRCV